MLKRIEMPPLVFGSLNAGNEFITWFDENIEPLNKLIEGAKEVTSLVGYNCGLGFDSDEILWTELPYDPNRDDDPHHEYHKAYLVGIEPIKQESCADVLDQISLYIKNIGGIKEKDFKDLFLPKIKAALGREK